MFLQNIPTLLPPPRAETLAETLNSDPEDYWSYETEQPIGSDFAKVRVIDEEGSQIGYL